VFDAVLVANRGEIAVRVVRTLRRLGVRAVVVHSDADATAPHVRLADEAVRIGPAAAAQSYLAVDRVIDAALRTGAQAVHPGYGFLSEDAGFARACGAAGLVLVGPPVDAIEVMGDKIAAKCAAEDAGVPVVPGVHEPGLDDDALVAAAARVGFPVMVKAAAGGGGRGMRVVDGPAALPAALAAARREASAAFGDDRLLLERAVARPRHLEVQVLADAHGAVVHLGERECSLQRRHQKVVEEAPSPRCDQGLRAGMGSAAIDLARAVGYRGAGTVEYLVGGGLGDGSDEVPGFAFLEMNTRLQVEHPVTEAVYGVDLVEQQLRVAAGEHLPWAQEDLRPRGHAIEARVYAEDPSRGFLPTGGTLHRVRWPSGHGVRVDAGVDEGDVVGSAYDPLLAKVVAHGPDRATALRRLDGALAGTVLLGVTVNTGFLRDLLAEPDVRAGRLDTQLIERRGPAEPPDPADAAAVAALAALAEAEPGPGATDPFDLPGAWRVGGPAWVPHRYRLPGGDVVEVRARGRARGCEVAVGAGPPRRATATPLPAGGVAVLLDGVTRRWEVVATTGRTTWVGREGRAWALERLAEVGVRRGAGAGPAASEGPLRAPLPGTVRVVAVADGDPVTAGQTLVVLEAMKMEHPVVAPVDGVVGDLAVRPGQQVPIEAPLLTVTPAPVTTP